MMRRRSRKTVKSLIVLGALCAGAAPASAKDFVYADRKMTCAQAVAYRDKQLFPEYVTAVDGFDAKREQRSAAVVKELEAHIAGLTKDLDLLDAELRKRLAVVVAGLVMSYAGKHVAASGRPDLSELEKKALQNLADRANDWRVMLLKYATDTSYKLEAMDVVAVPAGFAAGFFPTAEVGWKVGMTLNDVSTAVAEHHIAKRDARVTIEILRAGVKNIAAKMRMPRIREIQAIKEAIDVQYR
jgi:hypothetical protein